MTLRPVFCVRVDARDFGGTIKVEPEKGKFTRFIIELAGTDCIQVRGTAFAEATSTIDELPMNPRHQVTALIERALQFEAI